MGMVNNFWQSASQIFYMYASRFALIMIFGLPWSHAFFYIGFAGLLLCVLFSFKSYSQFAVTFKIPVVFWAISLFLWILAGYFYSDTPSNLAMYDLKKYRKLLLLPVLVFVFQDIKSGRKVIVAYVLGVCSLLLFTLMDGFRLNELLGVDIARFRDQSYSEKSLVYWRNHIVHGFHASILFAVCALTAIYFKKARLVALAICAICVYDILFFIHGRAALLGLTAAVFLLIFDLVKNIRLRIAISLLVFLCAALVYNTSEKIQQRVMSVIDEGQTYFVENNVNTSGGNRLYFWIESYKLFKTAPVLGHGPGSFREQMLKPGSLIPDFKYHHAHNEYITLASQHGMIGLLIFAAFIYSIYAQASAHPDRWLGKIIVFSLAVFLVNALTDSSLHNESEGWTLVLLACLSSTRWKRQVRPVAGKPGYFRRYFNNCALKILKQPLSRQVASVSPEAYILDTGVSRVILRSVQRKCIFWLGGQHRFEVDTIEKHWRRGLFLYHGENQIGDALMDLAPRSMLADHGLSVDLLTSPQIARLFDKDRWFTSVNSEPELYKKNQYDFAIVLNNKRRPLACKTHHFKHLPWVSIHKNYFGPEFHRSGFAAQRFADLLKLNMSDDEFVANSTQKLAPTFVDRSFIDTVNLRGSCIALCIGGVDPTRTYKRWDEVVGQIGPRNDLCLLLLGSDNGAALAHDLTSRFSATMTIHSFVGQLSILQTHEVMAHCSLIICTDGGLLHVAASTNVPLIGLFSSLIDPLWRLQPSAAKLAIQSSTLDVNDIAPTEILSATARYI